MKVYFAGPLFTPYVREYISRQVQVLRSRGIEVFVPHEAFRPLGSPHQAGASARAGSPSLDLSPLTHETIFRTDYAGLASSDAVVALLDGTQVDDGTACEIGIFYGLLRSDATKRGIIGLSTDSRGIRRPQHGYGVNLFVWGVLEECGVMLSDFDEVIAQLEAWDSGEDGPVGRRR